MAEQSLDFPGRAALILLGLVLLLAGCNVVREDRTIEFSSEADSVGFQHGDQGVFVADKDGGGLKKVFQPDADVLATSTPLWSPAGRRMIFTTARAVDGDAAGSTRPQATFRGLFGNGTEADPAGELFVQVPVIYTCWLRDEASGEAPVRLFEARCDHVGYVAANLAVRWHPRGDRILYIDRGSSGGHALLAYDLKTKVSRPIFPHQAPALIFDWSPDGENLACVLGTEGLGGNAGPDLGGIWIGRPDADPAAWWHVPDSRVTASQGESLLERLRAVRPAWTADGRSFAFVTRPGGASPADSDASRLWIGRLAERVVEPVASDKARLQDLHWSPRGDRLGLVRVATVPGPIASPASPPAVWQTSTLHVWERSRGLSGPLNARPIRRFAGWCAAGDHLAYVVPDDVLGAGDPLWSFLLIPNPTARDAVVIDDGESPGSPPSTPAFSGLRVTFPHWSPSSSDEVLSLWCTFSPSHLSTLARIMGGQLRSGDPAALLDARTGTLAWMAVSPLEEAQIGHYEQIKHNYAEAWRRYERAEAAGPGAIAATEPEPRSAAEWFNRLSSPRGLAVFQFACLSKLGRHDEARARLESFRKAFPPRPPSGHGPEGSFFGNGFDLVLDQPGFRESMQPGEIGPRLIQDLYIAQVLLSLDASDHAREYFRSVLAPGSSETETARFSAAVVLSQVLLLERRHEEYAELAAETLAPMLVKRHRSRPAQPAADRLDLARQIPDLAGGLALLPLTSRTFLSGLPDARRKSMLARWEALRNPADDDGARLVVDLLLEASYRQLGRENSGGRPSNGSGRIRRLVASARMPVRTCPAVSAMT